MLFACSGGGEEKDKGSDKSGKEKKEKSEQKKDEEKKEAHHQGGGPDDYSGEYRAGIEGTDLEAFGEEGALSVAELPDELGDKDSMKVKLKGEVTAACPKKGCWMKVADGESDTVMVRFRDYSFFVPKSSAGSDAVVEGKAFYDTVSVKELKHYAKDAGKSEKEIAAIEEPRVRLAFTADRVLLQEGEE